MRSKKYIFIYPLDFIRSFTCHVCEQESFRVRFIEEQLHEGHSTLDFVVSSSYDDYELKVRMIKCAGKGISLPTLEESIMFLICFS